MNRAAIVPMLVLGLVLGLVLAACSSVPAGPGAQLQLYRAHAGAPVGSFRYLGRMDSWEALGDNVIAVWTRPREAWLIDLVGICDNLEYTPMIGISSSVGQVHAGFDKVLVRDASGVQSPCYIQTIRPLDVDAIRKAQQQQREAKAQAATAAH